MRTVTLDFHDFSILRSRIDMLLTLKEHHPNLKISLFTIPYDYETEMSQLRILKDDALKKINENKDWLEFIPHGLAHIPKEFENADREIMVTYVENIIGEMVRSGLPEDRIVKGFCAPYWQWNQDVVDVLNEYDWWGAIDRNQPNMIKPKRFYKYTHSIDEPFWLSNQPLVKLHGHMMLPSRNNLEDCLLRLMKISKDVQWEFASEYVES